VKSKEELRSIFNAVEKLRALGERLCPPHMKPLQGEAAASLASCARGRGEASGARSIAAAAPCT
jgi:hypothetical protein